ncbi:MAG: alpha/beta hydrolase [Acidobacteriaceae bacterium]
MPSKKTSRSRRSSTPSSTGAQPRLYGPPPNVGFRWLIAAAATAVALGALGAYLVLGLIFYQNQAMLLFHPSPKITTTPASDGLTYQEVALNPEQNGKSLLTGWWIPAEQNGPWRNDAILYLHGASGSLSETLPQLKALHSLGINIFAIDYRGFGKSAEIRPTEQTADADAVSAWAYLRNHQHFQIRNIVVYGQGAGAAFAANLAMQRPVTALVLAQISPTAHAIFQQDPRARLLPLFLLANQHLDPAPDLKRLHIPKLFLDWPDQSSANQAITRQNYQLAAQPRQLASLPTAAPSGIAGALQPFLAQVLPASR